MLATIVTVFEAASALMVFTLLGLVSDSTSSFALPVVGDIRDRFPGLSEDQLFSVVAGSIGLFFLIRGAVYMLQTYVQNRVANTAGVALSERLIVRYLAMPYVWHSQRNSAELIRNANQAVGELVAYVFLPSVRIVAEGLVLLGILVVLLVKAPAVTLAAMGIIGLPLLVLLRWIHPQVKLLGAIRQEEAAKSLQALRQILDGIREITVLGRVQHFVDIFVNSRRRWARSNYLSSVLADLPRISLETVAIVMILAFLAITRTDGAVPSETLSILGLLAYAVLRVMPAINRIVSNAGLFKFGVAAIELVHRDLHLPARERSTDVAPLVLNESLDVTNVSFAYRPDGPLVLSGVNLHIKRGQSIGIVGPTGGGKSTLIDLLLGLLDPTRGAVCVDGHDISTNVSGWHSQLGVVPQSVFITDDTLRRNIALGVPDDEIDPELLRQAIDLAQLEDVVAGLEAGVDTFLGETGVRLSGGQRQRVAIARALYRRPSVLFFDEGTSALDNLTERELITALDRLRGDHTIITVAHRLSTVRQCDWIVFLEAGRVSDTGPYDDLFERNPSFRSMAG